MSGGRSREEGEWEAGWEGHESAQRRRLARLSLAEKLEWLEAAQRIVEHLGRARGADDESEGAAS